MAGKQAKILTPQQVVAVLRRTRHGRYPQRDRVMILLSVKAGLRAGEIAKLTWPMVLDSQGRLSGYLIRALQVLKQQYGASGPAIRSERRQAFRPGRVVAPRARVIEAGRK